ncbi:TPA: hypothetical protein ACH3X1_012083 [Trebouxia sp. C0004]
MDQPFHVACMYTGSSVCYCPQGAGSAGGGESARHQQQVCSLWHLWQQQQKLFKPQAAVDIQLPKLMQRVKYRPPEDDLADGSAEADAERAVRAASKIAEAAVSKAVHAAAMAGLEYMPPPDMQLDIPRVAKVDSRQIERKAQAAQQSMARRALRLEKAQAAAVQAQLAARHMQRQSSQQKDQQQQPGRATLQQMLKQNKDQIHQALENSPPKAASKRHHTQAGPAASSGRLSPGAPAASRGHGPRARPAAQHDTEPPQRQRGQPQAHPNSPPLPPLSSSIHPAIQAKLQQAHNKLLGQSRPSNRPEESAASARPAASKPGPRAGQKGKANPQPQPTQEVAWEEPPPRQMLLRMRDIQPQLQQKWLQLYWPDDSRWWPAQVTEVNPKRHRAHLLYKTGEEEDLDLGKMVREGEVAWLHKRDMPGTGHAEHAEDSNLQAWHCQKPSPPSPQHGGARKRKETPPGRHSQPAGRPSSAQPAPLQQGVAGSGVQRAGRGHAQGVQEADESSSGSLEHPGMSAPRRQRASGPPSATARTTSLTKDRHTSGVPSRQQSGDDTSMQHGLQAIFKLGNEAVGRNIHVFQSEAGSWYNAHIRQCRPRQGILNVQYESGDQAVLKAKEEHTKFNIRLMPMSVHRP